MTSTSFFRSMSRARGWIEKMSNTDVHVQQLSIKFGILLLVLLFTSRIDLLCWLIRPVILVFKEIPWTSIGRVSRLMIWTTAQVSSFRWVVLVFTFCFSSLSPVVSFLGFVLSFYDDSLWQKRIDVRFPLSDEREREFRDVRKANCLVIDWFEKSTDEYFPKIVGFDK